MATPNNVQAAITAAAAAYDDLESKMQAAVAAGQAKSASDQALADATAKAQAAGDALTKAKQDLVQSVETWLTIPPVSSPVPPAAAGPVITQTVTASADAQPAK
ncbi:MAG TPA: hypothetical protein VJ783_03265 [Pirellulales bacterium]|nr:hypothetical protein [Pirellulales bacterium]